MTLPQQHVIGCWVVGQPRTNLQPPLPAAAFSNQRRPLLLLLVLSHCCCCCCCRCPSCRARSASCCRRLKLWKAARFLNTTRRVAAAAGLMLPTSDPPQEVQLELKRLEVTCSDTAQHSMTQHGTKQVRQAGRVVHVATVKEQRPPTVERRMQKQHLAGVVCWCCVSSCAPG